MGFFEFLHSFNQSLILYGGTFILVLSILVFIHEFGHYIVARWCGVKVETFSIGFGKEIYGRNDRHGTRWKISLIPLGGYVKMFGDTDPASASHKETVSEKGDDKTEEKLRPMTPAEKKVAFFAKSVWQRAAIVFAGPAINYIFAVFLMAVVFAFSGRPVTPPIASAVIVGSNADKYGFQPHDEVVSIQGKDILSFEDIRREIMIALDQEKTFKLKRGDRLVDIKASAEKLETEDRFGFQNSRGLLGLISPQHGIDLKAVREIDGQTYTEDDLEKIVGDIQKRMNTTFTLGMETGGEELNRYRVHPLTEFNQNYADPESEEYGLLYLGSVQDNIVVNYGVIGAFKEAVHETWDVTTGTLAAMGQIFSGTRSAKELGGVVRIGAIAGDMVQQGFIAMLLFTALLSINLGLINLFPIPLLDGGHLVFYFFEAALGKPVPERIQEYAFQAGFVFLIGLIVFTNLNDIMQLVL